ncbi:hypothetical protein I79_021785 [Cricetulus griseus]|uniref:Uncharacterized protein n=1 Tax=Cricetulus griseus TaxID=10029 RepID=G3IDK2_CRIGR|nr:hypothetical protein I79_021785 [Cricetulus griseus]
MTFFPGFLGNCDRNLLLKRYTKVQLYGIKYCMFLFLQSLETELQNKWDKDIYHLTSVR